MLEPKRILLSLLATVIILPGCANSNQPAPPATVPLTPTTTLNTSTPFPASPVPTVTLPPARPRLQGELGFSYLTRQLGFDGEQLVAAEAVAGPEQQIAAASTLLVQPFDAPIRLVAPDGIVVETTIADLEGDGDKLVQTPVTSAYVEDDSNLVLNVMRHIPAGSSISIPAGALQDANGNPLDAMELVIASERETFKATLAFRPFQPTDINLMGRGPYPDSAEYELRNTAVTEQEARAALDAFLARMLDSSTRAPLLERFDAAETKVIIPDPNLRAALLALAPTAFNGAISTILTNENASGKPYSSVTFGEPGEFQEGGFARADADGEGGRKITFHPRLRGEPFQALAVTLAHEALHQSERPGLSEEIAGNYIDTLAWSEMLQREPELAQVNTELVRYSNMHLMALLNSGQRGAPLPGIDPAPNIPFVYPNAVRRDPTRLLPSFRDVILRNYTGTRERNSPGNQALTSYVTGLFGVSDRLPRDFDEALLEQLDRGNGVFLPEDVVRLARILKLKQTLEPLPLADVALIE